MRLTTHRHQAAFYAAFFMAVLLTACGSLGLPTPKTMNEKIAAAQGSVTQIRASATMLLKAGKLSAADGQNVLVSTDAAAEAIVVARQISLSDPAAADFKLTAAVTILTAVQTYLATKGN
jgi:hypothetical protein